MKVCILLETNNGIYLLAKKFYQYIIVQQNFPVFTFIFRKSFLENNHLTNFQNITIYLKAIKLQK